MKNVASMPRSLARAVGDKSGKCEGLFQRLSQTDWGETNTYERICALISVLCDVAEVEEFKPIEAIDDSVFAKP